MDFALYLGFDIYVVDIDISRAQPKIRTNQALKGKIYGNIYTALIHDNTEPTFVSKRLRVPRRLPPPKKKFAFWGDGKKIVRR